jgi:hypothetical protein
MLEAAWPAIAEARAAEVVAAVVVDEESPDDTPADYNPGLMPPIDSPVRKRRLAQDKPIDAPSPEPRLAQGRPSTRKTEPHR